MGLFFYFLSQSSRENMGFFYFPSDGDLEKMGIFWACWRSWAQREQPVQGKNDQIVLLSNWCISYKRHGGNFLSVTSDWYLTNPGLNKSKVFHPGLYKSNRRYLWRQIFLVQNHYHSKMFSLGSVCLVKLRSLTKPSGASECWMAIF